MINKSIYPTYADSTDGGMSLREYMATAFMAAMIGATPRDAKFPPAEMTAVKAYEYADAMLKAGYP